MFEIQLAINSGVLAIDVAHGALQLQPEQCALVSLVKDFGDDIPNPPPIKMHSVIQDFGTDVPNPPPIK